MEPTTTTRAGLSEDYEVKWWVKACQYNVVDIVRELKDMARGGYQLVEILHGGPNGLDVIIVGKKS